MKLFQNFFKKKEKTCCSITIEEVKVEKEACRNNNDKCCEIENKDQ